MTVTERHRNDTQHMSVIQILETSFQVQRIFLFNSQLEQQNKSNLIRVGRRNFALFNLCEASLSLTPISTYIQIPDAKAHCSHSTSEQSLVVDGLGNDRFFIQNPKPELNRVVETDLH